MHLSLAALISHIGLGMKFESQKVYSTLLPLHRFFLDLPHRIYKAPCCMRSGHMRSAHRCAFSAFLIVEYVFYRMSFYAQSPI